MNNYSFQFSKITNMEVASFDNSLSNFYGNGIEGTIKEDIQNALDARLENEKLVKLNISLQHVHKNELPGIDNLFEHILSLKGGNSYTDETISYMKKRIELENISVMTIEDENTKGLTGADNGQSFNKQDTFGIYAYNKGVHFVEEDSQRESIRGGSHGIGKIANNAASDIHLMYFANCDAEGNQHVGGTVQLTEHRMNGQCYRSTGYFSYVKENEERYYPYINNFRNSIFKKDTRGLKIIIPYLREEFNNTSNIIKAVCDNFFMAIIKNNLEVVINVNEDKIIINSESLQNIVEEYYETDYSLIKKEFTPLYIETVLNHEPEKITVNNGLDEFNFDLYFNYNEEFVAGRLGVVRTIGMKIEDFKVRNSARRPFNAVLIGKTKEDLYLKSLENESHTSISANDIRDDIEKKRAKRFINNLHKAINMKIDEFIKRYNPTDGVIDTKDLIYQTESSFKKDLETTSEKLKIGNDQVIVKKKNKEKRNKDSKKKNTNYKDIIVEKGTPRKAVKRQPGESLNGPVQEYIIPNNAVERVTLGSKEIIRISTKGLFEELFNECYLSIRIIDGMGIEGNYKFNLLTHYSLFKDINTGNFVTADKYKVGPLLIKDQEINLELTSIDPDNKILKYLYEIEVKNDL